LLPLKFYEGNILVAQKVMTNTVLPLSKKIIARSLAGRKDSTIDNIRVYHSNALIASGALYNIEIISDTEVEFSALFLEASFSGDFEKATLNASELGDFSELTGFTANKPVGQKLYITWKIKIL
jgi:hypothetical protein